MDKLRIHQGRGGEKLLCSAKERTGHSPAAQVDRILAADEGLAEFAVSPDVHLGVIFDRIGPLRLVGLGLFAAMPVVLRQLQRPWLLQAYLHEAR
jgi:hypothetical protein